MRGKPAGSIVRLWVEWLPFDGYEEPGEGDVFCSRLRNGQNGSFYLIEEARRGHKPQRWNLICRKLDPDDPELPEPDWMLVWHKR